MQIKLSWEGDWLKSDNEGEICKGKGGESISWVEAVQTKFCFSAGYWEMHGCEREILEIVHNKMNWTELL